MLHLVEVDNYNLDVVVVVVLLLDSYSLVKDSHSFEVVVVVDNDNLGKDNHRLGVVVVDNHNLGKDSHRLVVVVVVDIHSLVVVIRRLDVE